MSKFCTSCDYKNIDIAFYCANCGNKLNGEVVSTYNVSSKIKKIGIVLIIFGVIYGIFNYSKNEQINQKIVSVETSDSFEEEEYEADKYVSWQDNFTQTVKDGKVNKYSLTVNATPIDSKIEIVNIDKPYRKNMKLEEGTQHLDIKSMQMKSGKYHIRVSKDGYKTFDKWILLEYNSHVTAILEKDRVIPNVTFNTEKENIQKKNIWECDIRWIIDKGKKVKPTNKNLQKLTIELINNMDKLHLKTQNGESIYTYNSFIALDNGDLGIDYLLNNRFVDIFQNGLIMMGNIDKGIDAKYFCKDMTLDIEKVKGNNYRATIINDNHNVMKLRVEKEKKSIKKYRLTINATPVNARVRILNIKPKYHDGMKLKKGKYHIEVSKRGFKTISKWVSLQKDTSLNIELLKNKIYVPQTIEDIEPVTNSIPIYNSPKTVDNIEPVISPHVGKRMSKKERKNYNKCLTGRTPILCEHSWLTSEQTVEVRKAERRVNYNKCLTGRTPILCEHSWLTSEQTVEVRKAERRVNYNKCLTGRNPILCEHSWLTSKQTVEVRKAERRVNYNKCLTGRSPILCEHSWLTIQQAQEVKRVENR